MDGQPAETTMPEPSAPFGPQQLQELEDITRLYGQYGRTRFGWGLSAVAAWVTLAALVHLASPGWGRLLLVLGGPLWFVMVAVARRWYQRRGSVIPVEEVRGSVWPSGTPRVNGLLSLLLLGGFPGAALVARGSTWFEAAPLSIGVSNALAVASLVATALLAWRVGRGYRDTMAPGGMLYAAMMSGVGRLLPGDIALLTGAVGLVGVAMGVYQHTRFRRLERRLLALREVG